MYNKNINSDNHRKKNSSKVIIPKSSSTNSINDNITHHFLSDNKKTTKIILIKNLNKIENIDKKIFQRILNYKIIISAFLKNQ